MKQKHNFSKFVTFLLFVSLYFSANSHAQKLKEEPIRFHKDYSENGLIFGTISFPKEKPQFNSYFPYITCISDDKKKAKKNSGQFRISPEQIIKMKHNGELEGGKTYLFVMEKEPGQYAITNFRLNRLVMGGYSSNDTNVTGMSIPFDVKKGEITYIGEITINEYAEKGEPIITIADKAERDIQGLKNRQKFINWDAAVKSELKIIENNTQK